MRTTAGERKSLDYLLHNFQWAISHMNQLINPSYPDFLSVSAFLSSLIFIHNALKGSMESCNIKWITNWGHYRPMVML